MSVTCHAILDSSFEVTENAIFALLNKLNQNLDDFKRVPYIDLADVHQRERWDLSFKDYYSSVKDELEENDYITLTGPNGLVVYLSPEAVVLTEITIWRWFLYEEKYTIRFRTNTRLFAKLTASTQAIYVPDATYFGVTPFELFEAGKNYTQLLAWITTHLQKIESLPISASKKVHLDGYFVEEIETEV